MPLSYKTSRWLYPLVILTTLAALLFANPTTVRAATCTAIASGTWNTPGIWAGCGGGIPLAGDDVIIGNGFAVDMNVNPASPLNSITVQGGGATLTDSVATNFTLSGLQVSPGGSITLDNNPILDFNGAAWTQAGPVTMNGATTFSGNTTFNTGNWFTQLGDVTITGTLTDDGNTTGIIRVTGDWVNNGTFNGSGGIVRLQTAGATIGGTNATDFSSLVIAAANVTATSDINLNGNLTVNGGADFTASVGTTMTVTGTNTWTQNGPFTHNGTVNFNGTTTLATGNWFTAINDVTIGGTLTDDGNNTGTFRVSGNWTNNGTFDPNNGLVLFNGTGTTTIGGTNATPFHNVSLGGTPLTVTAAQDISIANDFTLGSSGAFTGNAGTAMTVTGTGAWTQNGSFDHNGTVNFNGTTALNSGNFAVEINDLNINGTLTDNGTLGALRVTGNWANNGTFNANNDTVTFQNTGGGTIGGANATGFHNLTIGGTPTTVNATQDISIANDFTLGASGNFTGNAGTTMTVTGTGAWSQNGPFDHNGTVNFNGTTTFASGTWFTEIGNVVINGTLGDDGASGEFRVTGDFTNSGTFAPNGGTVIFNSGGTQNLTANNPTPFFNLTVTGGTTLVETLEANNATIVAGGTIANNASTIRKVTKTVAGTGPFVPGLAAGNLPPGTPFIDVTVLGSLSTLQVDWVGSNSPNAGAPQQTGSYWNIAPISGGLDYRATLNLPHNNVTDPSVCQWSGGGTVYDCASTTNTTALVTRAVITDFGAPSNEWLVGAAANADLAVAKTSALTTDVGGDGNPDPGDTITYTVTVTNNGPEDVAGATLTDTFPGQLTLTGNTPSVGAYNTGTGVWSGINVTNGNSVTLQLVATINAGTNGQTVTNTAEITTSPATDPNTANNSATVDFVVSTPTADLALAKTSALTTDVNGNGIVDPGDTVTYTITLANGGPRDATAITVTDTLPGTVTYASDTPSTGTFNNGTGVWTVPTLNAAANATLDIVVTVNAGTEGQTIANTASITAATPANDPNAANNAATVALTIGAPPAPPPPSSSDNNDDDDDDGAVPTPLPAVDGQFLFITTDKFIAEPGENVQFIVTITNQRKTNVDVTLTFSEPLRLLGSDATKGNPAIVGDTSKLLIGAIETGEVVTFTTDTLMPTNPVNDTVTGTVCADANEITQVCASADVLIITTLPETGETPLWRSWVIGVVGMAVAGGLVLSVTVVRRPQG